MTFVLKILNHDTGQADRQNDRERLQRRKARIPPEKSILLPVAMMIMNSPEGSAEVVLQSGALIRYPSFKLLLLQLL